MQTLRVAYADFWPEWDQENFIKPILDKHYNVVLDQQNPDVCFHSIFGGSTHSKYKCKKIEFLGENRRPNPASDYTISFEYHSPTNYRLPLWQVFIMLKPELWDRLTNRVRHEEFVRFASFTVSNPGNFLRNGAFNKLSEYKKVHSYGRYLNNDPILVNYSQGKYWRDAKDAFFAKNPHKFMLTYENNAYPGYCTEKLMDAFLAGSMPIYWGDTMVKEDWNEKAFLNVLDYPESWWSVVKRLDNDPETFAAFYDQPVFTPEQEKKHRDNMDNFENWLVEKINQ